MVITALKKAYMVAKPVILNSDQGCQFTSNEYMNFLKENQIRQSMDGKSRWADNIMIERWFRSFKYEEAYLTQYNNIREARKAIDKYVHTYNFELAIKGFRKFEGNNDNILFHIFGIFYAFRYITHMLFSLLLLDLQ